MAGIDGWTRTYRLSASKRIAKFSALISDSSDSGNITGALYCSLPSGQNVGPVAGVTVEHYVEPNQFYPQDTDPSTITGTTPASPYASLLGGTNPAVADIGPTLQYAGQARCYAASGNITAGALVCIADAYGRVDTPTSLGISAGNKVYPVGIARSKSTKVNDVVLVELNFDPVTTW